jgi:hypothetical protein
VKYDDLNGENDLQEFKELTKAVNNIQHSFECKDENENDDKQKEKNKSLTGSHKIVEQLLIMILKALIEDKIILTQVCCLFSLIC